jgi:class 3 adenylate cyclase
MVECSRCRRPNPPEAGFCNGCGMPLTAAPELRKTVTVVFCDVVGSTALGERLDPELLREEMSRFYATVREPIERHGGTIEKVIGDAAVAVFGIPVLHEDDALRAARAALEVRDAVRDLADIEVRIGVNTGDVLAGDASLRESLVVGDSVNVAARIEQAAGAGEVLVGEATWALIRHAARGVQVAPFSVKGKSQPLIAWRLESVDPAATGHRRRLDLPMVGRQSELELLHWSLNRAAALSRAHLVAVLGQPGIGKSRLVSELARTQPGDVLTVAGHCRSPARSWSLEPLVEAMRAAVPAGTAVADLLAGDPDAHAIAACLTQNGAGVPDVAWAASRMIGALTAERTVVVVLEDVHWADELLLDVVEQLLVNSRRRPLVVICTARPEFADRRPQWGTTSGATRSWIALERLDDAQTEMLLTNAGPALRPEEAEGIVATAEGNPLFAEHLAALVSEHGSASTAVLPRSIQVLLTARLETVAAPQREVVSAAAVAGRDFSLELVEALTGRPVAEELEELARQELIEPIVPGRHRFTHALLQEAAYELIPKQRRSHLHLLVAGWQDEHAAGDAGAGEHLERAYRLRDELGLHDESTERIREDAGARLTAAGRRGDALGDPAGACRLLERAVGLLPETSPTRVAAQIELAAAGWNLLGNDRLLDLLNTAADQAAALSLRALELRARILRLGAVPDTSEEASIREILRFTDEALIELKALGDRRATATALCTRAETEVWLGQAGPGVVGVRRALDLLRAADEDMVWALSILVLAVVESPVPIAEGDALFGELLDEVGVRPTFRSELLQGRASLRVLAGEPEEAWAQYQAAQAIEQEIGRLASWHLFRTQVPMLLWSGRFEEAAELLSARIDLANRAEQWQRACIMLGWQATALAGLGRLDAAREAAGAARQSALRYDCHDPLVRSAVAVTDIHLQRGDLKAALSAADEAVEIAGRGDWVLAQIGARQARARVLRAAGRPDDAEADEHAADELAGQKGTRLAATLGPR